jgi:alanine-synthesizing transaminase
MEMLDQIPGVSCVTPRGALYAFPKLDPKRYPIVDDEKFVLDLLRAEHMLLVQGTGFNWPHPDHVRIVTLPHVDDLTDALQRFGRFLEHWRP